MIKLDNVTLRVKKIRGAKNGDFCVADLSCDVGEFKVKDPILDQFEDGEYTGTAWISEIFLSQYVSYGKGVTEIRARLHDLHVDGVYERQERQEPVEPDPIEETAAKPQPQALPEPVSSPVNPIIASVKAKLANLGKSKPSIAPAAIQDNETLFGELWERIEAREPFKLDPTIDRQKLRDQAAVLNQQLGYRFDAKTQVWSPLNEEVPA